MMEEKGVSGSFIVISDDNSQSFYPIFIGVSCAFFALRLLPEPHICDENWSEFRNRMLKGSALLGLLVSTVQRNAFIAEKSKLLHELEKAHMEIAELKKTRSEDAKANEKVVSIFAAREQSWFDEQRKLNQQISALVNDLRVVEEKRERSVSELCEKMEEIEVILELKDKMIEEAERRRLESEEKLKAAEGLIQNLKGENERHSSEISKHKTAFIELVSNQKQLEEEMARTLRQVEGAKKELDSVLDEKEQLVLVNQRLSVEIVRMHKDLERKSKVDMAEKQMLLKEVKSSKVKRKQAEVEAARWKAVSESKQERMSLRNMFSKHVSAWRSEQKHQEMRKGVDLLSFLADPFFTNGTEEFMSTANTEKHELGGVGQRHNVEIYALMEQLRQKDEKLEALKWQLMSTELESRRLQSHIETLNCDITKLRQDNAKLEDVLIDREAKLHSLQEQMMVHFAPQKLSSNSPIDDAALGDETVWSRVKVVKRKPVYTRQEMKAVAEEEEESGMVDETSPQDIILTLEKPYKEIKEGKDSHIRHERIETEEVAHQSSSKTTWKMDVHALGVSFKVKRLRQQLLVLERLIGKEDNSENERAKGFYSLMSLLNKQLDRYHSLEGKIDQLCKTMHEKKGNPECSSARAEDDTKRMEHFLEETFQLQRYIVATGQKLMEVQSMIASNLVAEEEDVEKHGSFEIERYGESLKTLFRETQRGLEVRISRIIGDLEGTLARNGFNTWQKL